LLLRRRHPGQRLRFYNDRLRTVGERIHRLPAAFPAAPFFKRGVDAAQHGFQWHAGVFPGLDQRPIERRQQKQPTAARLLKPFFDFGEIVEVVQGYFATDITGLLEACPEMVSTSGWLPPVTWGTTKFA